MERIRREIRATRPTDCEAWEARGSTNARRANLTGRARQATGTAVRTVGGRVDASGAARSEARQALAGARGAGVAGPTGVAAGAAVLLVGPRINARSVARDLARWASADAANTALSDGAGQSAGAAVGGTGGHVRASAIAKEGAYRTIPTTCSLAPRPHAACPRSGGFGTVFVRAATRDEEQAGTGGRS